MKKPNLQRLAQRSKIYLRKASPTILSGLGAAGAIVTSVLAVRATPKALRKIRADSKTNHDGDPEAYSKLEAVEMTAKDDRKNAEGYNDPTAYNAIKNVEQEQDKDDARFHQLLNTMFSLCELADFHIEGRVVLKDKRTGKVWR